MTYTLPITVIEAQSSLAFVEEVFRLYHEGAAFAICRPGVAPSDYPSLQVRETLSPAAGHGWARLALSTAGHDPDGVAQVVFSSGTEGRPKAIVLTRRALADVEDRLIEVMGITDEIREYIGVPVTYSFGLGRTRVVARAGGAFYLPERFDPVELRDMLAAGEINAISAVPSLWRILLAQPGFLGALGDRVRWIEIGSQYMSAAEKTGLRQMFPKARIVQHYGLTEASRSTFLVIDGAGEDEEVLESVGRPYGQTEIRIGDEGEICIRGPHLASGMLDAAGDLVPVAAPDGLLHTRDRGEIREGLLHYLGRLDDQINLSGIKLAAESLENEVAGLLTLEPGHFAISSVEDALRGETILLAHDAHAAPSAGLIEAALLQVLGQKGIQAAGQIRILTLDELPRTGSNKVQRKELRGIWTARAAETPEAGSSAAAGAAVDQVGEGLTPAQERIAQVWRSALGPVRLRPESGFYDVGGDSLGAMQIGLKMEASFPHDVVRATLEGRSLAQIAALLEAETADTAAGPQALPDRTVKSWAVNMTRGFMVLAVLLSHWMPGIWARIAPQFGVIDPMALISRMGTPGFAIVFGLGIACFMLDGYPENSRSVRRRVLFSMALVFVAVAAKAGIGVFLQAEEGGELTSQSWALAFYSVLTYYFLALLSIPLWLPLLHGRIIRVCAIGIPVMWAAWILSKTFLWQNWPGALEWLRLMIVARYSYFGMTALVLAGIALGTWMMRATDITGFARRSMMFGALTLVVGMLIVIETNSLAALFNRMAPFWSELLGAVIQAGFAALFLGASMVLARNWNNAPALLRLVGRFLILLGGMALPVYALHVLVIPIKEVMLLFHAADSLAYGLPLIGFFAVIAYGMWRLDRMYFR